MLAASPPKCANVAAFAAWSFVSDRTLFPARAAFLSSVLPLGSHDFLAKLFDVKACVAILHLLENNWEGGGGGGVVLSVPPVKLKLL